ncbi:transglutaminase family protein [Gloeothece verrucosa]|uniref:DUF2126 domain-containing protein n=1 Tax=Gloeothece verrucosa (strain PCC 7822) TaxID=497965 RepID=E0UDW2_GLOV7|nr:transglutaminase family protein [Gloeothece verrucosa]ADN16547.1 Protein of unknown function DUF2126 [Gloeothece verrucosa PCC 7822]
MTEYITLEQWQKIDRLGDHIEDQLQRLKVGLTMGGEPTFISVDDFESQQWQTAANGSQKRQLAGQLLKGLADNLIPAKGKGLLHYGNGKYYPGEKYPRWALGYYWLSNGVPIWQNSQLLAIDGKDYGHTPQDAKSFITTLVKYLGVGQDCIIPAYERETDEERGYILPLLSVTQNHQIRWSSCHWKLPEEKLYLLEGNASMGLRLPLNSITWAEHLATETVAPIDANPIVVGLEPLPSPDNSICVALTVEIVEGVVHVFLPPFASARGFLDLISTIEHTAAQIDIPVMIEGFPPPINAGIEGFLITPDPGVIEVNIHPASNWDELVEITSILYQQAHLCRLGTEKYLLDGRRISTGGGAHITIGGNTPLNSPVLRRPDLLRSFISYWINHPSLSYLFSGLFVGATSQSPRMDETRWENLYELEVAFDSLEALQPVSPELIDRLLSHLLVDLTGNTHRSAFCIDKLFPTQNFRSQLGLLEFRFFDMPPDLRMRLLQMLLVRGFVALFWEYPYNKPLIHWGSTLYDRFMLPHYLKEDLMSVIGDLQDAGYAFELDWFESFFEFRFPCYGRVKLGDLQLELRSAIEPWPVLGDALNSGGTSRPVDSSMERIQVKLSGENCDRYLVLCNNYLIPMNKSSFSEEYIGAVRFRARVYGNMPHPLFATHSPLRFTVVDKGNRRSLGGCKYYVDPPHGNGYTQFASNHQEAQRRMKERFIPFESEDESVEVLTLPISSEYPLTLDLRRVREGI